MPQPIHLTLPEKKLLLAPDTTGLQLLEYALLDLLASGGLELHCPSRGSGQAFKNGFLRAVQGHPLFRYAHYKAISGIFESVPSMQVSRFLKSFKSQLDGDFDVFKSKYVIPLLEDRRSLVSTGFFGRLRSSFELTEKGQLYRKHLAERLHRTQTAATPLALEGIDSEILLLGHAFLSDLGKQPALSKPLHQLTDVFSGIDAILDANGFLEDFLWELNIGMEEVGGSGIADIFSFSLPEMDWGGFDLSGLDLL
jgi:hypothetical protein